VRARASEIALRRAVGASRASIWRLFTIEGLVVGLGGGIAGAALGLVAVVTVCAMQGWTAVLNPQIVAIGVGIGALSGVISAVFPATAAARSNPALAIRS
jgi:macrolide transport system ATP-binding/permease protein